MSKTPRTVLFTWEIGQGFGHVLPLLPIARKLHREGHRIVFALRDVRAAGALLKREGFTVLQAPTHPDQFFPANGPQPQSMADILSIFGFASEMNLSGLIAAWEGVIIVCQPDVIVSSYAPLSLLCGQRAGIPTVLMALPFELPSNCHPSPVLRTGLPPFTSAVDDRVIQTVNAAFGDSVVHTVHDIFRADRTFMMSFPELDSISPRVGIDYCGSFVVTNLGVAPVWPECGQYRIFAYLNAGLPQLDLLREQIHASPNAYFVHLRDATPSLLAKWQAANVRATSDVVRLDAALDACDAVLSYGGNGFVSASLLAGKPIVFFVQNLESYITAKQVEKLGAGVLPQPQSAVNVIGGLTLVLSQASFRHAAAGFASRYSLTSQADAISRVTDVIARVKTIC
jgi:hypothetical protein